MFKTLRSYIWWTYDRGSFHYDVMVTLILLFLFLSPHFINYRDRPQEDLSLHHSQILVADAGRTASGATQFRYEIRADDLRSATTDDAREAAMISIIEPIAGPVSFQRSEPVRDSSGKIIAYDAWVTR